jgi:hypothetical protein
MRLLGLALLAIAISCTLSIALLLKPDSLSNTSFTLATLWSLFLVTINWASSVYIFSKTKESTVFGILPSVSVLLLFYSFFSVGVMLLYWNANNFGQLPTSHWVIQILGFGIVTSIVILQFIATKAASVENPNDLPTKLEMINALFAKRCNLDPAQTTLRDALSDLEDLIRYTIPHPSILKNVDDYKQISESIQSLSGSALSEEHWLDEINKLRRIAKSVR